jgi:hypothetical protein
MYLRYSITICNSPVLEQIITCQTKIYENSLIISPLAQVLLLIKLDDILWQCGIILCSNGNHYFVGLSALLQIS